MALAALTAEGAPIDVEVGVSFVDEAEMAVLNREHLGGDGPTDVLSFPLDYADGIPGAPADGQDHIPAMAGDIVICVPVAARNAPSHAGTLDDELALLVVHAVLHLVGYDHAELDERAVMQRRGRELLGVLHGPLARDPRADPIGSTS